MALPVESDRELAETVGSGAGALPLRGIAGSGSKIDPYPLPIGPLRLLFAAGRATAAIFSPYRELFEASAQWAIVRWFWRLDWGTHEAKLSPAAEYIRNHHRTAFSEALGIGAALLVTEHIAGHALPLGIRPGVRPWSMWTRSSLRERDRIY
jgi:hypothetical protein